MTMNKQLLTLQARHDQALADAKAIQNRAAAEDRDLTQDEFRETSELAATMASAVGVIEHVKAEEARTRAVGALAASISGSGGQASSVVPPLLPSVEQLAEMHRAALDGAPPRRWVVGDDLQHRDGPGEDAVSLGAGGHRAALGTAQVGLPVMGLASGHVLRQPRRISTAARLSVETVTGVTPVEFPVFGDGTADITAEGATKSEYAAVTKGTATPAVIAVWTDATRQALMSMPSFEARLRAKLAALVAKREDVLMCARVLATSGIQTVTAAGSGATAYGDALLSAAALVLSSDVAAAPDLAVVHPLDVVKIFGGSATGAGGETPQTDLRLSLHGLAVYPSTAVTQGTALVGAWAAGAHFIVGMPPTYLVDAASQLKANKITILHEEAVTLAIDEPTAFVSVDLVP